MIDYFPILASDETDLEAKSMMVDSADNKIA